MKNIWLIVALLAWFQTTAQDKNRIETKGFIGMSMGPAIPLGNFADEALNNAKAGLAKTGVNLTLVNFGYRFGKHFGISAAWLGGAHAVDTQNTIFLSSNPWSYGSLMAGGLYTKNIGPSFFDGRFMIGYALTTNPDFSLFLEIESPMSFAYMAGIGIRPRVGNRFTLYFTMDYFHTKPTFKENNFEQSISVLFVNGGFCYLLK